MEIIYTTFKENNWIAGSIDGCKFSLQVFDESSIYGINKGRISRFNMIDKNATQKVNYDRDWNVKPSGIFKEKYLVVLNFFENLPIGKRGNKTYKAQVR